MNRLIVTLFLICVAATAWAQNSSADDSTGDDARRDDSSAIELFNERIMPIFRSPNPSSCVQCHLAAVDLKHYILPSHVDTFFSLRAQGLIDVDSPMDSKILKLIDMGEKDADAGAKLIHAKTRKAEYDAFAAWIQACCRDPELLQPTSVIGIEASGPSHPDEVIRHARKSRVVDSFVRNVWSQRMRCFPCHTPHEIDPNNPQHGKPAERHQELVKQFGQKMNIFRETPELTLDHLVVSSRKSTSTRLPMLNLDDPRKSLLILKPTAKLPARNGDGKFARPSSVEPVSHMGGLKMHVDDQSYKAFVTWIQDYANVVGNRYESVEDLPADNWHPTMNVLRMKDCPERWPVGTPVQLFVHPWDEINERWDETAIAFTQGTITPKRMVNGSLFILSDAVNADKQPLAPGKYRISIYVDEKHRLADDPSAMLSGVDLQGHVTTEAKWQEGFRNAEIISYKDSSER